MIYRFPNRKSMELDYFPMVVLSSSTDPSKRKRRPHKRILSDVSVCRLSSSVCHSQNVVASPSLKRSSGFLPKDTTLSWVVAVRRELCLGLIGPSQSRERGETMRRDESAQQKQENTATICRRTSSNLLSEQRISLLAKDFCWHHLHSTESIHLKHSRCNTTTVIFVLCCGTTTSRTSVLRGDTQAKDIRTSNKQTSKQP